MRKLIGKRLAKLDETISFYSCMRKYEDYVIIKMSKDIFAELVSVDCPFVTYSRDGITPNQYKSCVVELMSNQNYVAVAYYNKRTGKEHHIKEIKEDDNAI